MSNARYTIGLDYGTNSVRCLLVNVANGREVVEAVWNYPTGTQGVILSRDPNLARQHPTDHLKGAEITIKHSGLKAGTSAKLSFSLVQDDDHESASEHALSETQVTLAGDDKKLLEPQETKAKWPLTGIDKLEAGHVCTVACKVTVGALEIDAGHLHVHGPVEDEG